MFENTKKKEVIKMHYALVCEFSAIPTYHVVQFTDPERFDEYFDSLMNELGLRCLTSPNKQLFFDNLNKEYTGTELHIEPMLVGDSSQIIVKLICLENIVNDGISCCDICQYYFDLGNEKDCVTPYVDSLVLRGEMSRRDVERRTERDRYLLGIDKGVCPFMLYRHKEYRPALDGVSDYQEYTDSLIE